MKIEMDAVTSEVMSELELTQHDFWNVSRQTGIVLNTFVKMVNAKNVLEIGETAAQVKHLAKMTPGSTYVIDRRKNI